MLEVLKRKSPRGWIAASKVLDSMKRTTLASIETSMAVETVDKKKKGSCKEMVDLIAEKMKKRKLERALLARKIKLADKELDGGDADTMRQLEGLLRAAEEYDKTHSDSILAEIGGRAPDPVRNPDPVPDPVPEPPKREGKTNWWE